MRTEVQNRIRMLGGSVVAEFPSSRLDRRRMMLESHEGEQVLLVEFEHATDADTDDYFAPADVLDRAETVSQVSTMPSPR